MNWSPILWGAIIVLYIAGFVGGFIQYLITFIVAVVVSFIIGLIIQISNVAEDIKSWLLGFPVIIIPVVTAVLGYFGYRLSSDE